MNAKKNLLGLIVVAVAAVAMGYNTYMSQGDVKLSILTMSNLEALANDGEGGGCHYTNGYTAFSDKAGGAYDCCQIWVSKQPKNDEHCR